MDYKDIELKKINVLEAKVYHGVDSLVFWTPEMYIPYGLSEYDNNWGKKYEIKASFRNAQGQFLKAFHQKIEGFDKILKEVYKNTEYQSLIKKGNLHLKVPNYKGKFTCGVKSSVEHLPTIYSVKPGCVIRFLVKMDRFWNYSGKSGCVMVIKEVFIVKGP